MHNIIKNWKKKRLLKQLHKLQYKVPFSSVAYIHIMIEDIKAK